MAVSAPLASPTQNVGSHAQGALLAAQMLDVGRKAVGMLDPTSPLGQAVLKALKEIGKEVGSVPAETQVNSLQSQLVEARRNAMQRLALQQMMSRQGGGPAAAPGGGGAPGAAGPPQPAPPPMAA